MTNRRLMLLIVLPTVVAVLAAVGITIVVLAVVHNATQSAVSSARGGSSGGGGGSTATFLIGGNTYQTSQSGSGSFNIPGDPFLTYSGPLGCTADGGYFQTRYTRSTNLLFRYTATRADLAVASTVYSIDGPPTQSNGALVWTFPSQGITVRVSCPPPAGVSSATAPSS